MTEGIEQVKSKKIIPSFKQSKLKVWVKIQVNEPRVSGQKKDSLKEVISLAKKLDLEGNVYLATDSESYAHEMLGYFNAETLFQNIDSQKGFLKERIDLPKTKYEKNFINAGEKIFYLEYVRLEAVSTVA